MPKKQIKIKNLKYPKEHYEVYKRNPNSWNAAKEELVFDVNISPSGVKCWRLVYWSGEVTDLFESTGFTQTINHLFCGTEEECLEEIEHMGLKYEPEPENTNE